jgi:hypothetical protein
MTTGAAPAKVDSSLNDAMLPSMGLAEPAPKRVFYGLPCSKCGTYYGSDISVCPVCNCRERVSPTASPAPVAQPAEALPSIDELEEEREQFLKEFKAQLFSAHTQINAAASFRCSLEANHENSYEPAEVCKSCHTRVQDRADQMEAALHMDVKEASQLIYDAVWADTTDPSKTYLNAAQALLTELRKRAGIDMVLTTLQPYQH